MVVPELSTFNVELNTEPHALEPGFLDSMHRELDALWRRCEATASGLDAHMVMIGILPTVQKSDLCLENISAMQRYRALNEQVLRMRDGAPLQLDIRAAEHLQTLHHDVMLEAATTSFQIHLRIGAELAGRAYNLSKMVSAPMVAVSANSPFLFGHDLWEETRIPLFEPGGGGGRLGLLAAGHLRRALRARLHRRVLPGQPRPLSRAVAPAHGGAPGEAGPPAPAQRHHLALEPPLVGFDDEGRPHIRIEHRVVPSGPSPQDVVANAAFYFGLLRELLDTEPDPEGRLPFEHCRENFYRAACRGLEARVRWFDGREGTVAELCEQRLIPQARGGLVRMGLAREEADHWLGIVAARVGSRRTGARWQRDWVAGHGRDFPGLVQAYREHQDSGEPVHRWSA
jgi:Uncharacterized conserved protein